MSSNIPNYAYLLTLIFGLSGLVLWDYIKKIALFKNTKAWAGVVGITVGLLLIWDILGLVLDIFHTNSRFVTGIFIVTPDLPIEEILFLTFLTYFTLLLDMTWHKKC